MKKENATREKDRKKVEVCINFRKKEKKTEKVYENKTEIILHPGEPNFCNKIFENIFF